MKNADRATALIILGICIYFWIEARDFSPLSGLFPQVIIVVLGGLSLLLLGLSFVRPKETKVFVDLKKSYLPVLLSVALMIAWTFLIEVFGFLVTSLLCFSLMTVLLDRRIRRPLALLKRIAIVGALTTGFYLFFDKLLWVSFPRGLLL